MKKAVAVILSLMIMTLTASCGAKNETPTNVETKTTTTTTTTTLSVKAKLEQELNTIKSGKGTNEEKIKLLNALKDKISKENKDVDFSSIIKEIDKYLAEITPTTTVKATEKQVENQEKEVSNDESNSGGNNYSSNDSDDDDDNNSSGSSDSGSGSSSGSSSSSDRRYQYGDRGYPYGYAEGAEDENGKYYTDERGDAWLQRPGESDWEYQGNQADLYGIV